MFINITICVATDAVIKCKTNVCVCLLSVSNFTSHISYIVKIASAISQLKISYLLHRLQFEELKKVNMPHNIDELSKCGFRNEISSKANKSSRSCFRYKIFPSTKLHRHLGPGYLFSSILSIKCASTTYMNPLDMFRCEINAFMNYVPFS